MAKKSWIERLPYPSGWVKWLYKSPIFLYRLGLGFIVGRLFMVLTTTGRKSGQPRRTAIEFHEFEGRVTVMSGWGTRADWYRNLHANPLATIQTWRGAQSSRARRITSDEELVRAFRWASANPSMRAMMQVAGFEMTLEQFLAQKERFTFVTFEPADDPTPEPLKADLTWIWAILLPVVLFFSTKFIFQSAARWAGDEAGYLLGFAFYWLFWCLLVPGLVFKKPGLFSLLRDKQGLFRRTNWLAVLLWIVILIVSLWMYGQDFWSASPTMILAAIPLATINGLCEEILWRGMYTRLHPNNPWMGIIVPSLGFALWHFSPQTVFPAEIQAGFVLSTLFLGLAYGFIAYRTGSARWTAIMHSLTGILALSGMLAPSFLHWFGR
jgi:deazaflavin-dependent oxidoreductase (nitroreductase family)